MTYGFPFYRTAGMVLLSVALAACSTDDLAPSARLDTSTHVSAIQPKGRVRAAERQTAYPDAAPDAFETTDPEASRTGRLPAIDSEAAMTVPPEGVSMDAMLGVEPAQPRVVGLAEEQNGDIAEGNVSQPVVGGIGGDEVRQIGGRQASLSGAVLQDVSATSDPGYDPDLPPLTEEKKAAEARRQQQFLEQQQRTMLRRSQAQDETQVAFLPRAESPLSTPEAPDAPDVMPASEVACRQRLKRLKVEFREVPRISKGRACGIDYPIELSGLSGGIDVKPAVTLNCQVTDAFAQWVKNELAPSARYRYLSGIKTIKPLGGYSCRTMNSKRGNPMSEHAHGNAIDVGKFVLNSGKEIDVRKPGFFAFREKGLLKAVRSDSCKYFNTVLGPGSDASHKDHFHFDLRSRKSGYRHCD